MKPVLTIDDHADAVKPTDLDARVFRMYDVRGKAGTQITPRLAEGVGRALGTRIRRAAPSDAAAAAERPRAVVARDVRHTSPELAACAVTGLRAAGVDVLDIGVAPTPALYHALHRLPGVGGGVMVTASHNPKDDNGLKLCLGTVPLVGDEVLSLRTQILAGDFTSGAGTRTSVDHAAVWLDELAARFAFARPAKVVVDCGNGVMGPPVLALLARLGVEVVPLYCDPDGDFPHHVPDPQQPECMLDLARAVRAHGADAGLGFDGDGDRFGLVDERGDNPAGDRLLALFARAMLARYPGDPAGPGDQGPLVRFDVKCSAVLSEVIVAGGGVPWMGRTGHSLLKRDVLARDAILGGELSGHFVFNRGWLPIDDALHAALFLLELRDRSGGPVSALFAGIPARPATPELKLPCADEAKFDVVAALVAHFAERYPEPGAVLDIDGARVELGAGTWFLVRASNTSPMLTVRIEAATRDGVLAAGALLAQALAALPGVAAAVDATPLQDLSAVLE